MLELCVSLTSNTECSPDPVMVTIEAENGKVATPPYVRFGHLHVVHCSHLTLPLMSKFAFIMTFISL